MHKQRVRSGSRLKRFLTVLVAAALIGAISYLGVKTYRSSYASTGPSIYVTPASGSLTPGGTLSVTVRTDSGTNPVNSLQASINYDSNTLQYLSMVEGGVFSVTAATSTDTPGVIRVGRAAGDTPVTGDNPIVTLNFKVLGRAGAGSITVDRAYSLLGRSTDNTDILQSVGGGSYTVASTAPQPQQQALAATAPEPASPAEAPASPTGKPVMYLSPASGTFSSGSTVSVALRINSYDAAVTTVQSVLEYPADKLQYTGVTEGGVFPTAQRTRNTPGSVDIIRAIAGGGAAKSGENTIVTVNFKVLGSGGTAALGFGKSSAAYDASASGVNILDLASSSGASFNLAASGGGTAQADTSGQKAKDEAPKVITSASQAVTITTTGKGKAVINTIGNETLTELSGKVSLAPAVTTAADGVSGISKVEYYLDKKLVSTRDTAPFSYDFDTTKMRNGRYVVTVKTFFTNGTVDSQSDTLLINNAVTFAYVVRQFAPSVIVTLAILAGCAVVIWKLVMPRLALAHFHTRGGAFEPDHDVLYSAANPSPDPSLPVMADPTVIRPTDAADESEITAAFPAAAAPAAVIETPALINPAPVPADSVAPQEPSAPPAIPPVTVAPLQPASAPAQPASVTAEPAPAPVPAPEPITAQPPAVQSVSAPAPQEQRAVAPFHSLTHVSPLQPSARPSQYAGQIIQSSAQPTVPHDKGQPPADQPL